MPGPVEPASGGYLADAKNAGGFGGRQAFPRHEQEQFPVGLRQGAQCGAETPALRLRVKPGVDRIPVHARPGFRRSGRLAVPEIASKHVQRYPVQPGQSAALWWPTTLVRALRAAMKTSESRSSPPRARPAWPGSDIPLRRGARRARPSVPAGAAGRREARCPTADRPSCPAYAASAQCVAGHVDQASQAVSQDHALRPAS